MWITYGYYPAYTRSLEGWWTHKIYRAGPDLALCVPVCNECVWLVPGTLSEEDML